MNYREVIDEFGAKYPDRIAFKEVGKNKEIIEYSYAQFYRDIKTVASWYVQNGYEDKHIAMMAPNCYRWIVFAYAIYYVGAVAVYLHNDLSDEEAIRKLERADVDLLVTDRDIDVSIGRINIYDAIPQCDICSEFKAIDTDKLATLIFTSGTTGVDKIVMLSQKNMMPLMYWAKLFKSDEIMHILFMYPFSHTGVFGCLLHLSTGNTICIQTKPKYFFRDLLLLNPDSILGVPVYVEAILKKINAGIPVNEVMGNRCKMVSCGGAAYSIDMVKTLSENGIEFQSGFGQTESGGTGSLYISTYMPLNGSVGKPSANVNMKIDDGEICIQSEGVMLGYYKDPEATAEVLKNGWLYTGDLGYIDEDGFVYVTGRKKNLIILSNGKNISPEELEMKLKKCQAINEVVVKGENTFLRADIYANEEDRPEIDEFVKEYNRSAESYKRIQKIVYSDTPFEKTLSGKIKRY